MSLQVQTVHYSFGDYMTKRRWTSIWAQYKTISELAPDSTLEIGPGLGLLKLIGNLYGIDITTFDLDSDLKPDFVGNVTNLPFNENKFDLVCAFQVLEHLKYEDAQLALREMKRVSGRNILISLPNAQLVWRYCIYLPKFGERKSMFARPFWKPVEHKFDGEHYWELNKRGYEVERFLSDISKEFRILKNWRSWDNPYHHFFLLEKLG
ncbi:class I SAM-dependent methyltransferase [Ovoidimarina sediminis]|uniref:class I SAM-dependent methyltransferase n=1 Tax=Ovoidimarina sediminis TaxID=3079856 RepID=UPI00290C0299|nr:class I SAM-dependent methyltransferase [Rhodophyticola sp. MJ-SS7]MDU8946144.1 class I SAM-dependent methyltransferase [Rhodophyticola sp. MJ-SS7]